MKVCDEIAQEDIISFEANSTEEVIDNRSNVLDQYFLNYGPCN